MSPSSKRPYLSVAGLTPENVRGFLMENPDFLADNADILEELVPPETRRGDGVQDFQHFMVAKIQDDFTALKAEHEDLIDLLQENLLRQNRMNTAILALMDAPDFESTLRLIGQEFADILEQEAVGFFLEAGGWLDVGDYDGLKVVSPGVVNRWLNGREVMLEEVPHGLRELYGDASRNVRSQALVRLTIREGLPPGLLALGHADPMHYATDLATEQVETLGGVIERCLGKWL
ncbi:MAG TPA: hypothetical protein DCY07_04710 [Rhodospirillaceae bacterium]|nr:hypothetical protein [Rhodospirillaceae bacterium]